MSRPAISLFLATCLFLAIRSWIAHCDLAAASEPAQTKDEVFLVPHIAPAFRDRIDRLAADQKLEVPAEQNINFAGNITAWMINQLPLSADEEFRLARAAHEKVSNRVKLLAPPAGAQRLFDKLVGTLPARLKPTAFKFVLYVIDSPRINLFTNGAGQVYVSKGLVDQLLARTDRGHAALAFMMAHELGHICLEHCRVGYQRKEIQEEMKAGLKLHIDQATLEKTLQTAIAPVGLGVHFLYSREQEYAADLIALHLCRNAEFNLDHCLEALRYFIALEYPGF